MSTTVVSGSLLQLQDTICQKPTRKAAIFKKKSLRGAKPRGLSERPGARAG